MRESALVGSMALPLAGIASAQNDTTPPKKEPTPEGIQTEIESLKAAKVAWRGIDGKSCLLEGLRESRRQRKPLLL